MASTPYTPHPTVRARIASRGIDLHPHLNSCGDPIGRRDDDILRFWSWAQGTKVLDSHGRPLVVYQWADRDLDRFPTPSFFTAWDAHQTAGPLARKRLRAYAVYLRIRRPFRAITRGDHERLLAVAARAGVRCKLDQTSDGTRLWQFVDPKGDHDIHCITVTGLILLPRVRAQLHSEGYDGLHCVEGVMSEHEHESWVPLNPFQIKSAQGNDGYFRLEDSCIYR